MTNQSSRLSAVSPASPEGNSSDTAGIPRVNQETAAAFDEISRLLQSQLGNPFRIRAYRHAASILRAVEEPVDEIFRREGLPGLERLPDVGRSLSRSIAQQVTGGHIPLLDQLRGEDSPERRFSSVPGIGPGLAERVHHTLDIETLGELLAAAIDGRLASVPGFGPGRVQAVRDSLDARRSQWQREFEPLRAVHPDDEPSVDELLDIDAEYRRKAELGRLRRIAPRRFNPTGEAWLPILHTTRGERHYHAMFSNTARAHELGTTRDWVVISREDDDHHGQWTVITSQFGSLKGHRIVRGREDECAALLLKQDTLDSNPDAASPGRNVLSGTPGGSEANRHSDRSRRRQLSLFPQFASTVGS